MKEKILIIIIITLLFPSILITQEKNTKKKTGEKKQKNTEKNNNISNFNKIINKKKFLNDPNFISFIKRKKCDKKLIKEYTLCGFYHIFNYLSRDVIYPKPVNVCIDVYEFNGAYMYSEGNITLIYLLILLKYNEVIEFVNNKFLSPYSIYDFPYSKFLIPPIIIYAFDILLVNILVKGTEIISKLENLKNKAMINLNISKAEIKKELIKIIQLMNTYGLLIKKLLYYIHLSYYQIYFIENYYKKENKVFTTEKIPLFPLNFEDGLVAKTISKKELKKIVDNNTKVINEMLNNVLFKLNGANSVVRITSELTISEGWVRNIIYITRINIALFGLSIKNYKASENYSITQFKEYINTFINLTPMLKQLLLSVTRTNLLLKNIWIELNY